MYMHIEEAQPAENDPITNLKFLQPAENDKTDNDLVTALEYYISKIQVRGEEVTEDDLNRFLRQHYFKALDRLSDEKESHQRYLENFWICFDKHMEEIQSSSLIDRNKLHPLRSNEVPFKQIDGKLLECPDAELQKLSRLDLDTLLNIFKRNDRCDIWKQWIDEDRVSEFLQTYYELERFKQLDKEDEEYNELADKLNAQIAKMLEEDSHMKTREDLQFCKLLNEVDVRNISKILIDRITSTLLYRCYYILPSIAIPDESQYLGGYRSCSAFCYMSLLPDRRQVLLWEKGEFRFEDVVSFIRKDKAIERLIKTMKRCRDKIEETYSHYPRQVLVWSSDEYNRYSKASVLEWDYERFRENLAILVAVLREAGENSTS